MRVWKEPEVQDTLSEEVEEKVKKIIEEVRERGDEAILDFTREFDGVELENLEVRREDRERAEEILEEREKEAIRELKERIEAFSQKERELIRDFAFGKNIILKKRWLPLDRVGIYVPGGRFPLVSSLLMAGVPARVAGVRDLIVSTPPDREGRVHPAILYASNLLGVEGVFRMGGAQAIAGMALGTDTIPRVDKVVGPGNIFVTTAKKLLYGRVGVDMLAGPSEVVILADEGMPPPWVEKSLLAQLEHGEGSRAILVTPSSSLARSIMDNMENLSGDRRNLWEKGGGVYEVENMLEGCELINRLAPEHLILGIKDPQEVMENIHHAGTIFLGYITPVTAGDLGVGTNHILPTSGTARFSSPLGVMDFLKGMNLVAMNKKGLEEIYPLVQVMCELEGLKIHREEVEVRKNEE